MLTCLSRYRVAHTHRWMFTYVLQQPTVIVKDSCTHTRSDTEKPDCAGTSEKKEYDKIKFPHGKHSRRHLPHFIIIGVKKSGTRALLNFLNIHPDIMTASQEVNSLRKGLVVLQGYHLYNLKCFRASNWSRYTTRYGMTKIQSCLNRCARY